MRLQAIDPALAISLGTALAMSLQEIFLNILGQHRTIPFSVFPNLIPVDVLVDKYL